MNKKLALYAAIVSVTVVLAALAFYQAQILQERMIMFLMNNKWAWGFLSIVVGMLIIAVIWILIKNQHTIIRSGNVLEAAVGNISQGLLVVDAKRKVPVLNQRAIELLALPKEFCKPGISFDDLIKWQLASGEFDNPEDTKVRSFVQSGGIEFGDSLYYRTRKDGTILEVRTRTLADGMAVRTFTDITQQKQSERELTLAKEAAEAATQARETFLAVMSHEIRTPLNGMLGMSDILLDMSLTQEARNYVQIIKQSGDHLLQLLNDILDFSKLNASSVELETVDFNPQEIFYSTLKMLQPQSVAKGLTINFDFASSHVIKGDPGRLRQILFNLVGNAIKFTEQGIVEVKGNIRVVEGTNELFFSIRDTGIGISEESQRRLFSEFTQADSSISRRFGGTGLGLAISKRLIERMGGTIRVESAIGEGSTFFVNIPFQEAENVPAVQERFVTNPDLSLKILLAEDNPTNCLVATKMLEKLGHKVWAVETGIGALEAVQKQEFDLVLMDMMMPEMDGLQATREIRNLKNSQANLPIIGLTANSRTEDRDACMAAGMNGFVTKPVVMKKLVEIINSIRSQDQQIADQFQVQTLENQILDYTRLEELWEQMGGETVADLVDIFVEDVQDRLLSIEKSFENQDMSKLFKEAHTLAGSAKNVGLVYLGQLADQLQNRNSGIKNAELKAFLIQIREQSDWGSKQLQEWLKLKNIG